MIITVPGGFEDFMREWEATEGDARHEFPPRFGIEMLRHTLPDGPERS